MIETTYFRGLKVSMRKHWEDDLWILEDNDGNILLVGSREQILSKYDEINQV